MMMNKEEILMESFKKGDKVTFSEIKKKRNGYSVSVKKGILITIYNGLAVVKRYRSNRTVSVPVSELRMEGKRSALCDALFSGK